MTTTNLLRLPATLAVATLMLTGCASGRGAGGAGRPASQPGPPPAFTFEERSKLFGTRTLPADEYRSDLDYRSELRVKVHPEALADPGRTRVLPPRSPEEDARAAFLSGLLGRTEEHLAQNRAANEAFGRLRAKQLRDGAVDPADAAERMRLTREQASSGRALIAELRTYVSAKLAPSPRDADPARRAADVDEAIAPLLRGGGINLDAMRAFVRREIAEAQAAAKGQRDAAEDAALYLRLRARLMETGGSEVPLHVQPYDKYEDRNVQQEPAVTFKMSQEEQERLRAGLKAAADAARFVRDLRDRKSELRKQIGGVSASFYTDLGRLRASLAALRPTLQSLLDAINRAAAAPALAPQQARLQEWRDFLGNALQHFQALETLGNAIPAQPAPGADPADVLINAFSVRTDGIEAALKTAREDATRLGTLLTGLPALAADVAQVARDNAADAVVNELNKLLQDTPETLRSLDQLRTLLGQTYPDLVMAAAGAIPDTGEAQFADALVGLDEDPNLFDVPVEGAPEGIISLTRNVPRGDHLVRVEAELVSKDASGARVSVRDLPFREFEVEKRGLVSTWSANLVFVKRQGSGDGQLQDVDDGVANNPVVVPDPEVNFDPAPSLSWTLHYVPHPPPDAPRSSFDDAWKFVNPGIGISVMALDFDNEGMQVGVGGHVSFLGDLVQVGMGYNLQADADHAFTFIGIGLIQAFEQAGGIMRNATR